jgi:hypothetical protein
MTAVSRLFVTKNILVPPPPPLPENNFHILNPLQDDCLLGFFFSKLDFILTFCIVREDDVTIFHHSGFLFGSAPVLHNQ